MNYDLTVPGWMTEAELQAIGEIADTVKPKNVLEIGSFAGRSSVCWAKNLPESKITCVDPWGPDAILDVWWMATDSYVWQPFSADEKKRSLYSIFLERTHPYPNISQYRIDSKRFLPIAQQLGLKYDLIFIDGDHSEQGFMTDLRISAALLNTDGTLVMHDYKNKELPHMTGMFNNWCRVYGKRIVEWDGTMIAAGFKA